MPPAGMRQLINCADLCRTTAGFLRGGSDLLRQAAGFCAQICARSADYCDGVEDGGAQMAACAKACRRCAEACWNVAAVVG
jgi:hypothetical protein